MSEQQSDVQLNSNYLLEQYKLYVEIADRVNSRRIEANKYFSTLLTGLFAALCLILEKNTLQDKYENIILFGTSILSIATCILWFANLRSFRILHSAKFDVIYEMEKKLSFPCYEKEWNIVNFKRKNHIHFTTVERLIPLIFFMLYFSLLVYSIYHFIN